MIALFKHSCTQQKDTCNFVDHMLLRLLQTMLLAIHGNRLRNKSENKLS